MSTKYTHTNGNIHPKNNYFLLSSWNYGSYSPTNPFYKNRIYSSKTNINTHPNIVANKKIFARSTTTAQLTSSDYPYCINTKRRLKQEERIVTNELLDCFNHYNKMQKHLKKGTFRPKSVNRILKSKLMQDNNSNIELKNTEKNRKKLKSDTSDYKYKLTYTEWLDVKNKQRVIFNEIIKKQKEEEKIMEIENKKIDIKYQEIKEQKFKEWVKKKITESKKKKKEEKLEELKNEEEKKQRKEKNKEMMDNWFITQAKKMEKEIMEKREKIYKEQEKENLKKKEKKQKQILNRKAFKDWIEKKEKEKKQRKEEEKKQREKEEEKKKRDYLKKKIKGFTIGPYTDAAALKEVQNYLVENNLNKEEDEYFQENSEYESRQ